MTGHMPAQAAQRWSILPAACHWRLFFWCALIFNFAFAVVYVVTDLNLFSDGSFFSFTIAVGRPWDLVWCNFPGRAAASYLLTALPARLYGDVTGSAPDAVRLYAMLYACWPTIGIAATRLLDDTDEKQVSAWCNVAGLTTPLFTFGFPTEIWITYALFWPTLCCCACAKRSSVAFGIFFLLLPLFVFTHEVALLFVPLLSFVAVRSNHGIRRNAMLAAIVAVLACWAVVEIYVPPCFPWARSFIAAGAREMLRPGNVVNSVSVSIASAMAGWLSAAAVANRARLDPRKATLLPLGVGFLCLTLYTYYYGRYHLYGLERYPARTLVAIQTFGFAVLYIACELIRQQSWPSWITKAISVDDGSMSNFARRTAQRGILAFVAYSVVAHIYANAQFMKYWTALNRDIDKVIQGATAIPAGFGLIALDDDTVRVTPGTGVPPAEWWLAGAITDHVVMRAPGYDTKRLIYRVVTLTGGTCDSAIALEQARGAIGQNSAALMRYFVCELYDGLYPPATWRHK